jgi:Uma2 family endonuclease
MSPASTPRFISFEEYLRIEEESVDVRHEYVGGVLYAMAGGTRAHNRIAGNIYAQILAAVGEGPCQVFMADMMVRVAPDRSYYPDVSVTCREDDNNPRIVSHPCLIVEVLSPTTEPIDRREKLHAYRGVDDLLTYLIVHQDERRVEQYSRQAPDGEWQIHILSEGDVALGCPPIRLSVDSIYRGVDLSRM